MITAQQQRERQGPDPGRIPPAVRVLGVVWGIGGIAAVLVYAAISLSRFARDALIGSLGPAEVLLLVVNTAVMAWAEGYRGFQQRFSPRVAARALNLYLHPKLPQLVFAPLFCAGFFGATARLQRTIWMGSALIVLAVMLFNQLPQPWRGILDTGVLVGLVWGTASLLWATWATFRDRREIIPGEVPPGL